VLAAGADPTVRIEYIGSSGEKRSARLLARELIKENATLSDAEKREAETFLQNAEREWKSRQTATNTVGDNLRQNLAGGSAGVANKSEEIPNITQRHQQQRFAANDILGGTPPRGVRPYYERPRQGLNL
jgi:hypothetical protein